MPESDTGAFKKERTKTISLLQLLFVTAAFALMVISSVIFVRDMLKRNLDREAKESLAKAINYIEAELLEPETVLAIISDTIRGMILRGDSVNDVHEYMGTIFNAMNNVKGGIEYDGFFGYFNVFGGMFLQSEGWIGDEGYDFLNRPWYKAAIEAGTDIIVTPMYFGIRSKAYVVTYARQILDDEGQTLGVVCLNMPLDHLRDKVINMQIVNGGYSILLSKEQEIIAHPSEDFTGVPAIEVNSILSDILNELDLGNDFIEKEYENYLGEWVVSHTMRLNNDWALMIITPKDEYYRVTREMTLIIGILGVVFAIVVIVIFIRIDLAKRKSDEQNRQKTALLAEMEKLHEADELIKRMLDATPLGCKLWNRKLEVIECNEEALRLFKIDNKQEFFNNFYKYSPEYQPNGRLSTEVASENIKKAFEEGYSRFGWMHQTSDLEEIPSEIILVRIKYEDDFAVAGYIRDLREYRRMMANIEQRDNLLNTVNNVAVTLLSTEDEGNIKATIFKSMELMGRSIDVERVQIWRNEMINGEMYFTLKYEWLSEIGMQKKAVPANLSFPYSAKPEWESKFLRGDYISGPLSQMSESDKDFLNDYDIKSIVIIPLFLQDHFWGFFSHDDCIKERTFSEKEISILRSGGLLIANAIQRGEMMGNIRNSASQLETALVEAQEANKSKSKFLATMSHEIRTPMNVILGITESQLFNKANSDEIRSSFERIYDSGNILLHIINDILDLSKIEAGKFELNPCNYEVLSLINDVANMNAMHIGHKQINFILEVDENIPLYLYGDELRIKQILNNLLSNAFKYTMEGEVKLLFNVENISDKKMVLVVCVRDTGQGMTPEQISKLFDEYSRFNLEANRTTVGTGLGMTITSNLLKMMGGMMCIDSEPGKGTEFIARIPQGITASGVLGKTGAENLKKFNVHRAEHGKHYKIVRELMPYGKVLIVDDIKSNLEVAKLLMNPYKLQISTANSGFEAIDIVEKGNVYDIIFMDHMMPKMDGVETTKKLRELGYASPIFALTASAVTGQKEMFLENGFDGFISKPIDVRQLNDSLNKYIRDKERSRKES